MNEIAIWLAYSISLGGVTSCTFSMQYSESSHSSVSYTVCLLNYYAALASYMILVDDVYIAI